MAYRRITVMDLRELIRLLRAGESDRRIAELLGHNRRTIIRYRQWATEQRLLTGELPTPATLQRLLHDTLPPVLPPQQTSSVARYADEIRVMRERGMEVAAIRGRLEERHGHPISYSAVWRFVRRMEPTTPNPVVRIEVAPGSEAQVDFGYAGLHLDPTTGQLRKSWVFVMVLSWSRHSYAEVVFDQRVETWLLCHAHAFAFFDGVPARVVPDNLKAAVVRASFGGDPVIQRAYRECAEHYGFRIDPNPPRSPHLKGKVEQGGVHYVKRNFLAGRDPVSVADLNQALWRWCREIAGQRVHGTTKQRPGERFAQVEHATLLPLPRTPYDPANWKHVRVYRDCYVTVDGAYYSVPFRLVGQTVWIRVGARTVAIYTSDHELVATHDRAREPGQRQTQLDHLPSGKVAGITLSREGCRQQAVAIGPATTTLVEQLLAHRPEDRLRSAGRILRLAATYSSDRLEQACARAQHFGEADYPTVKRILAAGLEAEPVPITEVPLELPRYTFVRQASEFVTSLFGGVR
jgi:transposase